MVLQFQFWPGDRVENLNYSSRNPLMRRLVYFVFFLVAVFGLTFSFGAPVFAQGSSSASEYLRDAAQLYQSGQYFKAARYAFAAHEADSSVQSDAYAWITLSLVKAGLPNAASYFFIRTLQSGRQAAIRSVLTQTQDLLVVLGADLLRKYLIRHTRYEDYDSTNRSAYLFALAKEALLRGEAERAVGYLNGISEYSPLLPLALQMRGSANAILGREQEAIYDFRRCANRADQILNAYRYDSIRFRQGRRESEDLRSRCIAGEARTLYQMNIFDKAERVYDEIPKHSFVWPDILFEQAWNAFGKAEYNRTLGKLVTYKSPALSFMFNSEVEVLRAQTFLALCLYADANNAVNEFNAKYTGVGQEVKDFVESNANNLVGFYQFGKRALNSSLYIRSEIHRLANRFVRGPYFQNLVAAEKRIGVEFEAIRRFDSMQSGVSRGSNAGFPGFLEEVLRWRMNTIHFLGGAYVKNSLIDYHEALIGDFEKMAFIKLEMLKRAKDKLIDKNANVDRGRGIIDPSRRNDQYWWSFNGEFWYDELGDYVFGLESDCR